MKQARFANQSARPRRVLARDRLAPAARRRVRARPPRGVQRAKPSRRREAWPWASAKPTLGVRRLRRPAVQPAFSLPLPTLSRGPRPGCALALAAVIPGAALVTKRLSPEHAALPVGRPATRRAARHVGQLARRSQVAGNAQRVLHHGEQLHPPLARGYASEVLPMADIRSYALFSRAPHRRSPGAEAASPEGRLRADARAPWTRRGA